MSIYSKIYCGNNQITSLQVANTSVKRAYLGNTLIYGATVSTSTTQTYWRQTSFPATQQRSYTTTLYVGYYRPTDDPILMDSRTVEKSQSTFTTTKTANIGYVTSTLLSQNNFQSTGSNIQYSIPVYGNLWLNETHPVDTYSGSRTYRSNVSADGTYTSLRSGKTDTALYTITRRRQSWTYTYHGSTSGTNSIQYIADYAISYQQYGIANVYGYGIGISTLVYRVNSKTLTATSVASGSIWRYTESTQSISTSSWA